MLLLAHQFTGVAIHTRRKISIFLQELIYAHA